MEHIIDFEQKQRSLVECIDQFHRSTLTDNTSRRQWFDSIAHYVKERGFDQGATSYKINYAKLKGEILSNSDKVEAIYKSIERVMNAFHNYAKIDIKNSTFAISLVADAVISQEELTWLIDTYDGIVHRFRANARLVEKFMNDVSGNKFLDDDYQARILQYIQPYEDRISDIEKEYTTPQVLPVKTTPQEKKDLVNTERAQKYFQKAIDEVFMETTPTGYKWKYNSSSNASLAYFLKCIYNHNNVGATPFKALERLFGKKNLAQSTFQLIKQQPWQKEIDELFEKD